MLSVAWFLAGNHCVLFAAVMAAKSSEQSCCHEPVTNAHDECTQCCQSLRAALPDSTAVPVAGLATPLIDLFAFVFGPNGNSDDAIRVLLCLDDPPGSYFSSVVLGTSLNALAPPVFVS
jgi:hypothetical protein